MRRTFRYLRIAVTALSLTACLVLIALWVRSYYFPSRVHFALLPVTIQSWQGNVEVDPEFVRVGSRSQLTMLAAIPHLCFVLLTLTFAGLPWVRWSQRFSLRALLIITTLVAVALAAIVVAAR